MECSWQCKVQVLMFADDLVLVAEKGVDTKRNVEVLNEDGKV